MNVAQTTVLAPARPVVTPRNVARAYAISFFLFTLVGLFFCTQALGQRYALHDTTPLWQYPVSFLGGSYITAAMTPPVFWLSERYPLQRPHLASRTTLHAALCICFCAVQLAVQSAFVTWLHLFPTLMHDYRSALRYLTLISLHQNALTYLEILGIEWAHRYYLGFQERKRRAVDLELQTASLTTKLAQAQFHALSAQLQPHFLFNTLNAISVLVRQGRASEAEEMLAGLSDLLRCVLDDVDVQEVSLTRELEYARKYLLIEQIRFQDRLRFEIVIAPDVGNAAVPYLCLQPLVENAVRHGISRRLASSLVQVSCRRIDNSVELRVSDDGFGIQSANSTSGIGLSNVRERLKQLYGSDWKLLLEDNHPIGAIATIRLPYRALGT